MFLVSFSLSLHYFGLYILAFHFIPPGLTSNTCLNVEQIASPDSMHETGCSGLVHWADPEGWDGEGSGRGVQEGGCMYTHG